MYGLEVNCFKETVPMDGSLRSSLAHSEFRRLIVERREACGIGLCGGYEQIARWLFREHNIVTSASMVCHVIQQHRQASRESNSDE